MNVTYRRPSQAGTTLLELVVVIGIVAVTALATAALWPRHAGEGGTALAALTAALGDARSQASVDGATVLLDAPDAYGASRLRVCPGRPTPASPSFGVGCRVAFTTTLALTLRSIAPLPPWAIFVDPSGSASAAAWSIGMPISGEPSCISPIAVVIGATLAATIDCATSQIVATPAG